MSLNRLLRRLFPKPPELSPFLAYDHARLTLRRVLNLHLMAWEQRHRKTHLKSRPVKLIIEATNVCNLECPGCFTGMGENGRPRSHMSFDAYKTILDEQAATLLHVEFYNWGEPLLNKAIVSMIAEAKRRGLATIVSTNFSFPMTADRAEELVKSGLNLLLVSVDGATQATYEKYRVGGDLDLVFKNVQLVADAKRRLDAKGPELLWGWHTFAHNLHEIELAREMAPGLGFDSFHTQKAWIVGQDWNGPAPYQSDVMQPFQCWFLWQDAVVHNDGGVAPCCATFYREDDVGNLRRPAAGGPSKRFSEIWNSPEMTGARAYFDPNIPMGKEDNVCSTCPVTLNWRGLHEHIARGGTRETYQSPYPANALTNHVFARRPMQRDTKKVLKPDRVIKA